MFAPFTIVITLYEKFLKINTKKTSLLSPYFIPSLHIHLQYHYKLSDTINIQKNIDEYLMV